MKILPKGVHQHEAFVLKKSAKNMPTRTDDIFKKFYMKKSLKNKTDKN
jgi:hypothetical protein